MLWSRVLADLIVVFHAGYVAFVVLGLAAILVGTGCAGAGSGISTFGSFTWP